MHRNLRSIPNPETKVLPCRPLCKAALALIELVTHPLLVPDLLARRAGVSSSAQPKPVLVGLEAGNGEEDAGPGSPHGEVLSALLDTELSGIVHFPCSFRGSPGFGAPNSQKSSSTKH